MRKRKSIGFLLALAAVAVCACSDVKLLRKAQAAYTLAERQFDAKCVSIPEPKGPPECPAEEAKLTGYYNEIKNSTDAMLIGPLPKEAKARLKAIPRELAKEK